jgi:hypothetical protein
MGGGGTNAKPACRNFPFNLVSGQKQCRNVFLKSVISRWSSASSFHKKAELIAASGYFSLKPFDCPETAQPRYRCLVLEECVTWSLYRALDRRSSGSKPDRLLQFFGGQLSVLHNHSNNAYQVNLNKSIGMFTSKHFKPWRALNPVLFLGRMRWPATIWNPPKIFLYIFIGSLVQMLTNFGHFEKIKFFKNRLKYINRLICLVQSQLKYRVLKWKEKKIVFFNSI